MTSLADRTIAALRAEHDSTSTAVAALTDDQLTGPSGAAEWTVASVLSHLGSGSVISLAGLQVALGLRESLPDGFNQSVWDRWNAMNPTEQRDGFVEHDEELRIEMPQQGPGDGLHRLRIRVAGAGAHEDAFEVGHGIGP